MCGLGLPVHQAATPQLKMRRVDQEQQQQQQQRSSSSKVVLPGDPLPFGESYLLGLNTHVENGVVRSSVCGVLQTVNRLVYVRPLRSRYEANVGDVVVGRVAEIANGKWLIDVRAARLATLSLGAVSLEVQRRRVDADLLEMASHLKPSDVVCCEVQKAQAEGQILLHTRSARYGKQLNGLGLKVPPQLVKRQSRHVALLQCGLQLILGVNGYLWVSLPAEVSAAESMSFCQQQQQEQSIPAHMRRQLAMVRNVASCLASRGLSLTAERIDLCVELAAQLKLKPQMLLHKAHADALVKALAAAERAALNPKP